MDKLERQPLPLDLGSTYKILRSDFWHRWEKNEEALSHREVIRKYYEHLQGHSSLDLVNDRNRQDQKVDQIQEEIYVVDVKIAKLQAKRESLSES